VPAAPTAWGCPGRRAVVAAVVVAAVVAAVVAGTADTVARLLT